MGAPITDAFAKAPAAALIPYLPTNWPEPDATLELMHACEKAGATLIELGVAYSDPSADGGVIQRASEQALANGATLARSLECAKAYRDDGGRLPVVLMGYANPFFQYGAARLARACADSGVAGVLAVDWPPAAGDGLGAALAAAGVDRIVLVAPTTPDARLAELAEHASGYIYYVSVQGITGAPIDPAAVAAAAKRVRAKVGLPVAVGFGVRTAADCARLGEAFDGVIVGTALIEAIAAADDGPAAATAMLAAMVSALAPGTP